MQEASEADGIPLKEFDAYTQAPHRIKNALERTFWGEGRFASHLLLTGPYGLHGLLEMVIYPFFDSYPTTKIEYWGLKSIFLQFCQDANAAFEAIIRVSVADLAFLPC